MWTVDPPKCLISTGAHLHILGGVCNLWIILVSLFTLKYITAFAFFWLKTGKIIKIIIINPNKEQNPSFTNSAASWGPVWDPALLQHSDWNLSQGFQSTLACCLFPHINHWRQNNLFLEKSQAARRGGVTDTELECFYICEVWGFSFLSQARCFC